MANRQPLVRGLTPAVIVVIVALLATFVAIVAIDPSVAIVLAIFGFIFGDDLLRQFRRLLESRATDPTTEAASTTDDPEDALERLRLRYADGELTDAEFERRLEVLLETETVADVERYLEGSTDADGRPGPELDADADRELERSWE